MKINRQPRESRARYLLRFDDICPTMNWVVWAEIETILMSNDIKPILAVVPENRDPKLQVDSEAADFWDRVNLWRARGWTIGVHGYRHLYVTRGQGIVGCSPKSEFSGLPKDEQLEKLTAATVIFRLHGIEPKVWVAPSHSFDRLTVQLLEVCGFSVISDGQSRWPYRRMNLLWVPVQLAGFEPRRSGIWTVNHHHNSWDFAKVQRFREDIARYKEYIVDLEQVIATYGQRQRTFSDRGEEFWRLCRGRQCGFRGWKRGRIEIPKQ